jgi:hypothetical protein
MGLIVYVRSFGGAWDAERAFWQTLAWCRGAGHLLEGTSNDASTDARSHAG